MSLFNTILEKLGFPSHSTSAVSASAPSSGGVSPPRADSAVGTSAQQSVDVTAKLDQMAKANPQKLNWKTSIVDLLKLLGLDSSFEARKKLAQELGYKGGSDDSSQMNIWLHRTVLQKLAENGGNIPRELL